MTYEPEREDAHSIRERAYEISQQPHAGTPEENWYRAERELTVVHEYDTADRDLERLGATVSRLPLEVGALWRLDLPRGERVEAWEPGNAGLAPPPEIMRLIEGVVGAKPLVPAPPVSSDPGAIRLRAMIEKQRLELLAHEPGVRLGRDAENLHRHRVAARRTRAFLRATREQLDPDWQQLLSVPLDELAALSGPVRDLDVLLEHVRADLDTLDEPEQTGGVALVDLLEAERRDAGRRLVEHLDTAAHRSLLTRLRLPPRLAEGTDAIPLEQLARKEFRRLARAVGRLGRHPDDEAIHRLRIALKRARYAAELADNTRKAGRGFLAEARGLQTLLGEHQDAAVAEERLRAATVVDGPTATAFLAGRIAERQRARRERALERLPKAWKRLRRSGRRLGSG
jgi:CHAD domain-containing protein